MNDRATAAARNSNIKIHLVSFEYDLKQLIIKSDFMTRVLY